MKLFSIFDKAAGLYNIPFNSPTLATAIRSTIDALEDPDQEVSKHPEDYSLHFVGTFNPKIGTVHVLPQPYKLTDGKEPCPLSEEVQSFLMMTPDEITSEQFKSIEDYQAAIRQELPELNPDDPLYVAATNEIVTQGN